MLLINPYRFSAGSYNPASLFEGGTYKGGWIDGTDASLMRQNSDGSTAVTTGDPVGWIDNKAGNSGQYTQPTSGLRPTLVAAGASTVLRFASAGGQLLFGSGLNSWSDSMSAYTIVMALNENTDRWIMKTMVGNSKMSTYVAAGAEMAFTTQFGQEHKYATSGNTNEVWSFSGSGSNHYMRRNGTQVSFSSSLSIPTMSGDSWSIGDTVSNMTLDLCQLFYINRQLTGTNLSDLERDMGSRYGVSW